jgi:hypothetical protein
MPYRLSPWWIVLSLLLVVLVGVQLIPYGRHHTNPPIVAEPPWDSPQTRALVQQACFDCHSNETKWPWYSQIAPASWILHRDVNAARARLNFSDWDRRPDDVGDAIEEALKGKMPRSMYLRMNPHARLASSDRIFLERGLARTLARAERQAGR